MLASTSTNTDGTIGTQKMKGSKDSITMEESSFNYSLVFSYSNNKSRICLFVLNHVIQYTTIEKFNYSMPTTYPNLVIMMTWEGQHNFQRCKRKGKKLRRLYFISVLEVLYHKAKEGKENYRKRERPFRCSRNHEMQTQCESNLERVKRKGKR